ncbi:DNA polymerase III subunit delta [Olivibacter ginsenosidimutans]|uniref:DNA polymerase III subunit delta n=1 Tax=Olivibacter ginsenosidimutans TaxID=1176537 RepID=A0ABP9C4X6_9SPHI
MQFKDIIGQEKVKEHLIRTVKENRISHAQLFLGPEGSGSLPLALAYAQYINCEHKQENDSCGSCSSCRKYAKLIHPDLHFSYPFFASHKEDTATTFIEQWRHSFLSDPYLNLESWRNSLDAGNKQANINIAECHHIIQKLSLKAFEASYKVLIMWLPEFLDKEGNTLLKLIEEPPENTLFLLVTQNQDQLLPTIISRTQLVKVNAIDKQSLADYLIREKGISPTKADQLCYISAGNMRQVMIHLADEGNDYFDVLVQWLRLCFGGKVLDLIQLVEEDLAKLGRENQKSFLLYAVQMMRDVILYKVGASPLVHLPQAELSFVEKFSPLYTTDTLEACVSIFEKTSYYIERNANPKILFLDVSLQLVLLFKR